MNRKNTTLKIAQSCSSRECKKNHRDEYNIKFGVEPTTPHELNRELGKIKCLYCGKITKIG